MRWLGFLNVYLFLISFEQLYVRKKNGYHLIVVEIMLATLTSVQIKHSSKIRLHGFGAHMVHYIEIRIQKGMNSFWTKINLSLSDSSSKIFI